VFFVSHDLIYGLDCYWHGFTPLVIAEG